MSEFITVARPYAKAAFDFAVEQPKCRTLAGHAGVCRRGNQKRTNGRASLWRACARNARESFIAVCGEQLDENGQNLIRVMAENGRLNAPPDVESSSYSPSCRE